MRRPWLWDHMIIFLVGHCDIQCICLNTSIRACVGADIVYCVTAFTDLLNTLCALCHDNTRFILVYKERFATGVRFFEMLHHHFDLVRSLDASLLDPKFAYSGAKVLWYRKKAQGQRTHSTGDSVSSSIGARKTNRTLRARISKRN